MMIQACSKPPFRLPKRIARIRRSVESRRMESLKGLQESLKKVAEKDKELLDEFTKKVKELWEDDDEDENNVEVL
jgi:hypothetical protein